MYNATIKFFSLLIIITIVTSCSDGEKERAQAMLDQSRQQLEAGNYNAALALIDSIDSICPSAVEQRREAMHLRPQLIEKVTLSQLATVDSLLALNQLSSDSMRSTLQYVKNPVEGYYVARGFSGRDVRSASGVYARMSPDGRFYIIASSTRPVKSTSVSITDGNTSAATPTVAHDGERNDRSMGAEVITFIEAESDTIGRYAMTHNTPLKLTFHGANTYTIPLPDDQHRALAQVYRVAECVRSARLLTLDKARLEKQLQVARSQMARTYQTPDQK